MYSLRSYLSRINCSIPYASVESGLRKCAGSRASYRDAAAALPPIARKRAIWSAVQVSRVVDRTTDRWVPSLR